MATRRVGRVGRDRIPRASERVSVLVFVSGWRQAARGSRV